MNAILLFVRPRMVRFDAQESHERTLVAVQTPTTPGRLADPFFKGARFDASSCLACIWGDAAEEDLPATVEAGPPTATRRAARASNSARFPPRAIAPMSDEKGP